MANVSDTLGDTLIPVINRLQDIFSQVTLDFKLNLPQVAVVGSQSSGKSSVLEALVGRDFLPRGPEICTRRPLVLQLIKTAAPAPGGVVEWGEFLHAPDKIFSDFDRIRQEILKETERVTGSNKGVSDIPIRLKIWSPNVLTMTLVDLPGITKVPVGDQPGDIERRIRDMIYEYIRHPTCIVLAVSPANVDLVNSDALQMAQTVDPEGARTIGVVTKLDIMDRGTNAVNVLKNGVVPLRLGYVGVVLRSQQDINLSRTMGDARKNEEAFFAAHPEYQEVTPQCGVKNLARRLNAILVDHIQALLPGLRRRLEEAHDAGSQELRQFGEAPPATSPAARGAMLLKMLTDYTDRFAAMLQGRSEELPTSELAGGARIRHVFQEIYVKSLRELNPGKELTDDAVRTAIKNSSGVSGTLLIPQEPFEILVRRAITKLLPPALHCKQLVHEELLGISIKAFPRELSRFPQLERRLGDAVGEFILQGAQPAEQMIRDLVACEHDYINTDHPEFIGGSRAVKQVMESMAIRREMATVKDGGENGGGLKGKPTLPGDGKVVAVAGPSSSAANGIVTATASRPGLKGLPDSSDLINEDIIKRTPGVRVLTSLPQGGDDYSDGSGQGGSSWFGWFSRGERADSRALEEAYANQASTRIHAPKPRNEQEEAEVEIIRVLVSSYFDIVRKTLQDQVPKAVMHFLVHHSQRGLHQHLITQLYKEELFEELVKERDDVMAKRSNCLAVLTALKAGLRAMDEIHLPPSFRAPTAPPPSAFSVAAQRAQLTAIDRHPSMSAAARLASVATASLSGGPRTGVMPLAADPSPFA